GLARNVAALVTQVEQLSQGLEGLHAHVTTMAEEVKTAAPAGQGQITGLEQNGTNLQQHDQAMKATHTDPAEHITQPETQAAQPEETQRSVPETPAPTRRRTSTRKTAEADVTT